MTPAAATSTCRAASASAAAFRRPDLAGALIATALALSACHAFDKPAPMHVAAPAGSWYVIAPGETLETIARRADVPVADLIEINGLADAADARPGRMIFILAAPGQLPPPPAAGDGTMPALAIARTPLRWPLAGGRIVV